MKRYFRWLIAGIATAASLAGTTSPAAAESHADPVYYRFQLANSNQHMSTLKLPDDGFDDVGLRSTFITNRNWSFRAARTSATGEVQYQLVAWPYPGLPPNRCLDVDRPISVGAGLREADCDPRDVGQLWYFSGNRIVHADSQLVVGARNGVVLDFSRLELQTAVGAPYQTFHMLPA
ncbi:RICIN domain-containing protein [Micromonospora sp. NPDC051141]|uniref:RICIN domain-containing protein n=1 Tax=Micromonospora sp. NPDC051141 TaxID=3364284 RepID=UPI0037A0679B